MPDDINTTDTDAETTRVEDQTNTTATAEEFDPERAMNTIKTLRAEAKANAKALKEATAKLKEIEDAKLSDADKLQQELEAIRAERDALVREAHTSKANAAIAAAASKANAIRPDAITRLVDLDAFDGDNAEALVTQVRKDFPELFAQRPGNADAGAGKGTPAKTDFNTLLRQAAGRG